VGTKGYVAEIFRSIQGEGPYVGVLQVFVRFSGCSLRCVYCDTARARDRSPECRLGNGPSARRIPNPVDSRELAPLVRALAEESAGIHSISVTGGEPLEQGEFLRAFLGEIRGCGLAVYLETNGLFEDAARATAPLVDIVSMDIKLPSLCGGGDLFPVYRRVLPLYRDRDLFCKVVVAEGFDTREFDEAVRLVARYDPHTPFIIQPAATAAPGTGIKGEALLACYGKAAVHLDDVRVIPQCHPHLGLA
jgi:organic radical activating enzyme